MSMTGPSGGGRRGRGRRAPMADINVTPLVDVMLVLLIIFMITAPLLVAGVPIDLPDSRAKPVDAQEEEPVQLSIDGDGTLYIGDEPLAEGALPDRLQAIALEDADKRTPRQVHLRAAKGLDYGRVMRVMGELNRAGLTRIALVTTGSVEATPVTAGSDAEP